MASSKNFSSDELKCSCCGEEKIQQWALDKLQAVRDIVGRPITVTSAYRCSNHPVESRKTKAGTHNQGIAFDIYVASGVERHELVTAGLLVGASGIGVDKNFIHLDWRDSIPVIWSY
ncbi:MAG: D-Ala-D-Ala carboxypeptidase family metallohydrolase [Bacteroidota bacterium]